MLITNVENVVWFADILLKNGFTSIRIELNINYLLFILKFN